MQKTIIFNKKLAFFGGFKTIYVIKKTVYICLVKALSSRDKDRNQKEIFIMERLLLEGKTAIVTGGAAGIGRAIVELYVREGANVVFTDLWQESIDKAVEEIKALGYEGKVVGVVADSSVEADAEKAVNTAIENFGGLDIMINNAGIAARWSLEDTDNDLWDKMMDVNLTGPMYYIRLALKHMLEKQSGSIITVSSAMGLRCASGAAYVTSKAGVIGLTRNVAFRGAEAHVRANCICPGHVETPMAKAVKNAMGTETRTPMSKFTDKYVNRRDELNVDADQIAYACLYLGSDMSKHVTGQAITVDAGMFMPF